MGVATVEPVQGEVALPTGPLPAGPRGATPQAAATPDRRGGQLSRMRVWSSERPRKKNQWGAPALSRGPISMGPLGGTPQAVWGMSPAGSRALDRGLGVSHSRDLSFSGGGVVA